MDYFHSHELSYSIIEIKQHDSVQYWDELLDSDYLRWTTWFKLLRSTNWFTLLRITTWLDLDQFSIHELHDSELLRWTTWFILNSSELISLTIIWGSSSQ